MANIRGMASIQDNRYDFVGDICAVQCIIIKHGYAHSGLNDDRGGYFVGAVREPLKSGQSDHKDQRWVLQGLYAIE